jgi:hypothetical protein
MGLAENQVYIYGINRLKAVSYLLPQWNVVYLNFFTTQKVYLF